MRRAPHVEEPGFALLEEDSELVVGSSTGGELFYGLAVASALVSKHHVRVSRESGRTTVTDLDSAAGTFVNGVRIHAPTLVRAGDVIGIGDVELTWDDHRPGHNDIFAPAVDWNHPHGRELLARLEEDPADEDLRQVLGDHLEEMGLGGAAVAIELQLRQLPGDARLRAKLADAASAMPLGLRLLVLSPPIDNCSRAECPGTWSRLARTNAPGLRSCSTCAKAVYFVASKNLARWHRVQDNRIVLDVVLRR